MGHYRAEEHIVRFLRENPSGHLHVVVGYASVWGLAWLQEHTRRRPVTLVIGDTKKHHFNSATDSDRRKALALLGRRDVKVRNWYRTARSAEGKSMLHAKAWVVADGKSGSATSVLLGSANLTRAGLRDNWETMALAAEGEASRIWTQLDELMRGRSVANRPWDATEGLVAAITEGQEAQHPPKPTPGTGGKRGCLLLAASIGATLALVIATTVALLL